MEQVRNGGYFFFGEHRFLQPNLETSPSDDRFFGIFRDVLARLIKTMIAEVVFHRIRSNPADGQRARRNTPNSPGLPKLGVA